MEQWQNLTFSLTSPNATFDNFLRNEHDAHYAPSLQHNRFIRYYLYMMNYSQKRFDSANIHTHTILIEACNF